MVEGRPFLLRAFATEERLGKLHYFVKLFWLWRCCGFVRNIFVLFCVLESKASLMGNVSTAHNLAVTTSSLEILWFMNNMNFTLSETQYDWKKLEQVTMKANFIHSWFVESEFIVKNYFYNWTSELGCIWHIFGKLGYFGLFLSALLLVAASAEVLEKSQK